MKNELYLYVSLEGGKHFTRKVSIPIDFDVVDAIRLLKSIKRDRRVGYMSVDFSYLEYHSKEYVQRGNIEQVERFYWFSKKVVYYPHDDTYTIKEYVDDNLVIQYRDYRRKTKTVKVLKDVKYNYPKR